MSGFQGSGDLYMDRLTAAGESTGLVKIGNATKLEIQEDSEIKERILSGKSTFGQVGDSVALKKPAKISLSIDDLDKDNLAMALLGDAATLTQASGSLASENLTAKLGKFVELTKESLTSGTVVVKDDTDTTTYTEGTDYEVNYDLGMIKAISGGAISESDVLHVSADYAAIGGYTISGSTTPTVKARLILDGLNQVNGQEVKVVVDQAVLTPEGGVDFLGSDFNSVSFSGTLNTLDGKTNPYTVQLRT